MVGSMNVILDRLGRLGVIPVVVLDDPASADALADALIKGGLPTAELTLRTPAALESIKALATHDDLLVGAGTVTSPYQAQAALDAGATYIVGPGFSTAVSRECATLGVPYIPGVVTPTEVLHALDAGWEVLKFFPAEAAGGIAMLTALSAPFGSARFVPTGGIAAQGLSAYLALASVHAVGGTWIAPRADLAARDFSAIAERAAQAVATVKECR